MFLLSNRSRASFLCFCFCFYFYCRFCFFFFSYASYDGGVLSCLPCLGTGACAYALTSYVFYVYFYYSHYHSYVVYDHPSAACPLHPLPLSLPLRKTSLSSLPLEARLFPQPFETRNPRLIRCLLFFRPLFLGRLSSLLFEGARLARASQLWFPEPHGARTTRKGSFSVSNRAPLA